MDILFIQHGDYGEAYKKMLSNQKETYRDQFRSVLFVKDLAKNHNIRVISFCARPHTEQLEENLWSIGIEKTKHLKKSLYSALSSFNTDLLICRTPHLPSLRWAIKRNVTTLPCFADTFTAKGIRSKIHNFILGRVLNQLPKPCLANHSLNASKSMMLLGVKSSDIVPWDWSAVQGVAEPKAAPDEDEIFSLMYIGVISKPKGVDTILEAMTILKARGINVKLNIAGKGDITFWKAYARELGIDSYVNFLGAIPSDSVLRTMGMNNVVIVPSKHEYPEGLPNTIYEALASRTPLIISDHPAFKGRLKPYNDCMCFMAGNADDLANKLSKLKTKPNLYELISKNTESSLQGLYIGEDWCDLITYFINDPKNKTQWTQKINLQHLLR